MNRPFVTLFRLSHRLCKIANDQFRRVLPFKEEGRGTALFSFRLRLLPAGEGGDAQSNVLVVRDGVREDRVEEGGRAIVVQGGNERHIWYATRFRQIKAERRDHRRACVCVLSFRFLARRLGVGWGR